MKKKLSAICFILLFTLLLFGCARDKKRAEIDMVSISEEYREAVPSGILSDKHIQLC